MGAKQSKRSVDISGKEAEGGEVAVAGAAGEGRVEQLEDADALKPQLNGAAHIQVQTDKEVESGTPENEKDATTEKEGKEVDDKETATEAVTNGETEPKAENGESTTPIPEEGKKPKKEKVKKKWSLRSISFSRKDKPKQEKKQKEEESKTNGDTEKVPEETAEAAVNEVAEEVKAPAEEKDEKTPETPVTEPLTNGTSTPESATAESPATEEPAPSPGAGAERPAEVKPEPAPERQTEPEQLPVNGLSIEETKPETPVVEKLEETKPEPPIAETVEIVPAPEIPKEVCVEQMPLLEPTPPPLPANPPPSSVASFAATTMAPELTDASLANTADAAIAPHSAFPETKDILVQLESPTSVTATETLESEFPFILKETSEHTHAVAASNEKEIKDIAHETVVVDLNIPKIGDETPKIDIDTISKETSEMKIVTAATEAPECVIESVPALIPEIEGVKSEALEIGTPEVDSVIESVQAVIPEKENLKNEGLEIKIPEVVSVIESVQAVILENESLEVKTPEVDSMIDSVQAGIREIEVNSQGLVIETPEVDTVTIEVDTKSKISETIPAETITIVTESETVKIDEVENKTEIQSPIAKSVVTETKLESEPMNISEPETEIPDAEDSDLPPPPEEEDATELDEADEKVAESLKQIPDPIAEIKEIDVTSVIPSGGVKNVIPDETVDTEKLKKMSKASVQGEAVREQAHVQSGDAGSEPSAAQRAPAAPRRAPAAPEAAAASHTPQEPLPVSDKLADLIPEVPDVPELNTETLQEKVTDVAVAN